jgi:ribosome-associated protein
MDQRDKKNPRPAEPPSKAQVEVTRFKGSGPGGQNRNKRETGIRLKHLPTGLVVTATERRSQGQNLDTAFERLEKGLKKLLHRAKPRKKTKPSGTARHKRLNSKKAQGQKKRQRGQRSFDD